MKRIAGIALGLGCIGLGALAQVDLAVERLAEGDWDGCRRESRRVLLQAPANEMALLLETTARLRQGRAGPQEKERLQGLIAEGEDSEVRAMAAYESAGQFLVDRQYTPAAERLGLALRLTRDLSLTAHASFQLQELFRQHPKLETQQPGQALQLRTFSTLWTPELRAEYRTSTPSRWASLPARWIIQFYRSQIRPAIGSRCSLTPSCSHYFHQAADRHGWLAIPLIADRFVREPGVVSAAAYPVKIGDETRFSDPVEDHDFWMKGAP